MYGAFRADEGSLCGLERLLEERPPLTAAPPGRGGALLFLLLDSQLPQLGAGARAQSAQIPGIANLLESILAPLKDTLDGAFGDAGGLDTGSLGTMSLASLSTQAAMHHGHFLRSPLGMSQTIIVELDGRVLTQAVVEDMPELLRLQGG